MAKSFRVSSTEPTIFTPVHVGPARATIDHGEATRRRQVFRKQQGPEAEEGSIMALLDNGTEVKDPAPVGSLLRVWYIVY